MISKTKRRATLMAAMEREEARPISRLKSYRDELAAAGMALQDAGGAFPSALSLALDRAQLALEVVEECTAQRPGAVS